MFKQVAFVVSVALMLGLACPTQGGSLVIGNFEGNMDGWDNNNSASTVALSTIGATSGAGSVALTGPANSFAWALRWNAPAGFELGAYKTLSADVTWVASEWAPQSGIWVNFKDMAINSGGPSGWKQYIPTDVANPSWPGSWDPTNWGNQTRTLTWDISQYDSTGATWLQIIFSTNMGSVTTAGTYYIDNVKLIGKLPKVIYVTSVKDNDKNGVQDDVSWANWLKAEGYDVDARPGNWSDPLDANEIAELNAADLIIASRGMATGDFDGAETAKWNALTTPILCTNAWMIRNNRWKWMNSGDARKDGDSPLMMVTDANHPIFVGVTIDQDGLADVLDPNAGSGHTSFLFDYLDPGNGTMLAMSLGLYTTAWIVEWQPGVEYYAGAAEIAAGKRMLFMAGTQDDPYTVPDGNIMPVGVFNLNANGQQLLRNTLAYLMSIPVENFSFELPGTGKTNCWDGETNAKGTFVDVPGWESDTTAEDSGVEGPDAWPGNTHGVWAAFMMGTDPSVWNVTSYNIVEGNKFILSVDARDNWTANAALPAKLQMTLFYKVGNVRIPLATTAVELTTTWTTFALAAGTDADLGCVDWPIGIELKNASNATATDNSWIGIDNVRLTVMK